MTQPLTPPAHFPASDVSRRNFAGLLSGSGVLLLAGCGGGSSGTSTSGESAASGVTPTPPPVSTAPPPVTPAPAPVISTQPQSQAISVGATVTFSAAASGTNLSYQWRRNGVALAGATNASLTVTVAKADSGALYSVVISNASGQVESLGAVLTAIPIAELSLLAGGVGLAGRVDGLGAQARFAAMGAMCVDRDGNVYILDTQAKSLRKVTPGGVTSTPFTNFPSDGGIAVDAAGSFFGVRAAAVVKLSPSGAESVWAGLSGTVPVWAGQSSTAPFWATPGGAPGFADGQGLFANFARPAGISLDPEGNLLVGDAPRETYPVLFAPWVVTYTYGTTIRKITPNGLVSTIAGIPGRIFTVNYSALETIPSPEVTFLQPFGVVGDGKGTTWVLERTGIRRIDSKGGAPVWVVGANNFSAIAYVPGSQGDIYVASGTAILKIRADGTQTVIVASDPANGGGVQLGPLPAASLGIVTSLFAASADVLYCCSENTVLKIQLA